MQPSERSDLPRLTTAQVAARLGIKQESVYAYVSRGLLSRHRSARGGGSTFDALEVESLARRTKGRRDTGAGDSAGGGTPLRVLDSGLTLIEDDELFFRGLDATQLCATVSFETAARWIWTGEFLPGQTFAVTESALQSVRASDGWRADLAMMDRLRVGVAIAGSGNPTRYELSEAAVVRSASSLIGVLTVSLHPSEPPDGYLQAGSTAAGLWSALTARIPGSAELHLLNAALVLLMDHDLAMSTLAARVAASARAHPYAVVSAGLAALDGTLHGAVSLDAHRLLDAVLSHGRPPMHAVADILRSGRHLPGFGHLIYQRKDPRAEALLALMYNIGAFRPAVETAAEITEIIHRRTGLFANVDLALAVLTVGAKLPADAGEAIFAVARTAGWIAHALEEYQAPPARLRPTARYTGPRPGVDSAPAGWHPPDQWSAMSLAP